ncbi:MAG: glycoside hydrolase family 88 protein [Anaerolineaceae bacterium]|nr:glycoside hydrolase family 88 protein [Anaerolineaceae bacterium]
MDYRLPSPTTPLTESPPWSQRIAASALTRYDMAQSRWHYKHGLLFKGVYHLWQKTGNGRYWQNLRDYVDHFVTPSGKIQTYREDTYNIDDINPGKLLFPLYRETGEVRYRQALDRLRHQLRHHPRTNEGGFWHKKIYPYQMWLDGLYMGSVFYAEYAAEFNEPEAFDDVAFQFLTVEKHTRDPQTGLLFHAWDESRQMPWANKETGCSPHFWNRAIGWYVMALVDVLDIFPSSHPARPQFLTILERTLTAVTRYQDPTTGLWWQVLDQNDRPGNYLEASGSCMFVYAMAKGVRQGILRQDWLPVAQRAFNGLLHNLVTIDEEGRVDLHGVCSTAGLGGVPYRDGSFEYYVNEPIITNDLHGVGAFLNAAVEMELAATASKESET